MDREQIIQMAREINGVLLLEILELEPNGDYLIEFAAAIRAATKEEDAKICESFEAWNYDSQGCAEAIRASK